MSQPPSTLRWSNGSTSHLSHSEVTGRFKTTPILTRPSRFLLMSRFLRWSLLDRKTETKPRNLLHLSLSCHIRQLDRVPWACRTRFLLARVGALFDRGALIGRVHLSNLQLFESPAREKWQDEKITTRSVSVRPEPPSRSWYDWADDGT